ncbi:MAG TPA: hypothetical protein VKT17_05695 [Acidobacteriota bacterium]|nr:hypothetical protein [Acidobacteriota bacterium]
MTMTVRALIAALIALPLLVLAGPGQIIENPAKALAKDAGRILKLAEVWRIRDPGGEFYFKDPSYLRIAEDGSIFLADTEQFLKFSADGKFLGNLYKKGQGPGEIGEYFYYHIDAGALFIQEMPSQRFWRADLNGVFQETINLAKNDYRGFVGIIPEGFLFLKSIWPPPGERTGKLMEILHIVALVGRDGSERRDLVTFRPKTYLAPTTGMGWDPEIAELSPDGKHLFAVHSRDYLIDVVDIPSGHVSKRLSRAYNKVPHVEDDYESEFRKEYGTPKKEFEPDVDELFPVQDGLWVATSTDDKAKGRLIDVFDHDGRFSDSFYLGAGRGLLAVHEGFIFCTEKDTDETITIAKYRTVK